MVATCLTLLRELCSVAIGGMQEYARSMKSLTEMDAFRASSCKALWKKLTIGAIELSREAVAYKNLVLDACLSKADGYLRNMLVKLAPGDWRSPTFKFPAGRGSTKQDAFNFLCREFLPLLYGHQPFEYHEGKWLGWERSRSDAMLPLLIHGLGRATYEIYMADHPPRRIAKVKAHRSATWPGGSWR